MEQLFTPEDAYAIGAKGSPIDEGQRKTFERYMTKRGFKKYFALNKSNPVEPLVDDEDMKREIMNRRREQSIAEGTNVQYRYRFMNLCWAVWRDRSNLVANALGGQLYFSSTTIKHRPNDYDPDEMSSDHAAFEQYMAGHCWDPGQRCRHPISGRSTYEYSVGQNLWAIWSDHAQMERLTRSTPSESESQIDRSSGVMKAGQKG